LVRSGDVVAISGDEAPARPCSQSRARAAIASSANQAPGSDNLLVSIRKAITTLRAAGYPPNLIILTPAASETLDTMVSGISGGTPTSPSGRPSTPPERCSASRAWKARCSRRRW
jgi:hypothetical protein